MGYTFQTSPNLGKAGLTGTELIADLTPTTPNVLDSGLNAAITAAVNALGLGAALVPELPAGARNGSNMTYTCTAPPKVVVRGGQVLSRIADGAIAADYSVSGNTLTMASPVLATELFFALV